MTKTEIKFGGEMYEFKVGETIEGILEEIREDVGKNKSNVYIVGNKTFWGAASLDPQLERVKIGEKVWITLVEDSHKFPSGRVGRLFKVEVDR